MPPTRVHGATVVHRHHVVGHLGELPGELVPAWPLPVGRHVPLARLVAAVVGSAGGDHRRVPRHRVHAPGGGVQGAGEGGAALAAAAGRGGRGAGVRGGGDAQILLGWLELLNCIYNNNKTINNPKENVNLS